MPHEREIGSCGIWDASGLDEEGLQAIIPPKSESGLEQDFKDTGW